jgi:NitT/TauT family transport system substrate-binding protein
MDLLRISATAHGVNYLPEYYATATGAFSRRGLEVKAWPREPWTRVLEDLAAGDADLVLGGIWAPMMYAGMGRDLVSVGQLNARFPMVILTREPVQDFGLEWLVGRTVLAPGAGGTAPYEFTAGVIREHGVDPGQIKFVRDLSTGMLRELFEHGLGDAMIADPLTAASLELGGAAHAALRLADVAGPMPNSVYYTDRAKLDEVHDRAVALMGAVAESMAALSAGADPAPVIDAEWPGGPRPALMRAATTLAANGTWSGIRIDPVAAERWAGILRDRGLMASGVPASELVDARVADAVEAGASLIPGSFGDAS